jgi:3-hydroxymyristoyl/3-hydroxydecanoyl-(acyl carrier protein) dehydratase
MIERKIVFSGEERFFQGHFPGFPVLPGVQQLMMAYDLARELAGRELTVKSVKRMKFVKVVEPGDEITAKVDECANGDYAYEISKGGMICSSGVLECC